MKPFKKIVAIEPTKLPIHWDTTLGQYGETAVFYTDLPQSNQEIIDRIGDADCVLLSYTSRIEAEVLAACPGIRYIGMCCSLYGPESANVDILYAAEQGITVTGVRDYGDQGVGEYVVSRLVWLLQGHGPYMWRQEAMELAALRVGILGMGAVASAVGRALNAFDVPISYYSRTQRPEAAAQGWHYLPLDGLLPTVDVLITCLSKNVVLLGQRELDLLGNGKILINTSLAPAHEEEALTQWLQMPGNYAFCDTVAGLGAGVAGLPNAFCGERNAGLTLQAKERLGQRVEENIRRFLTQ